MPLFVIEKKVGQFSYWWNETGVRWEGLINNASTFGNSQVIFWEEKIKNVSRFFGAKISNL